MEFGTLWRVLTQGQVHFFDQFPYFGKFLYERSVGWCGVFNGGPATTYCAFTCLFTV